MATVIADAGVGKSRLVREFTTSVATEATVLRGRCLPYGEGITFWPLVEVGPRGGGDRAGRRARMRPAAKLAELDRRRGGRPRGWPRPSACPNEQFPVAETFWAARRFLEVLGKDKPVTVVIDDIHWAEQTFLELIVHLVERVEGASVLLLCTSRHDLLETQAEWALDPNAERIVLQPLTDEDAARVVSGLLGEAGIAGEVQDRIVVAAEGNPLFVEQMLSMMIDSGSLHFADERWEPTGNLADLDVPPIHPGPPRRAARPAGPRGARRSSSPRR